MSEILYERTMSDGYLVRIRRLTPAGVIPVRGVIEIDRRAEGPHVPVGGGHPLALVSVEAESEPSAVASLLPLMSDDGSVGRLLVQHSRR